MVDPDISSLPVHILPITLPLMLTSENHGINNTDGVHPLTPWVQSNLVSLLPLQNFESRTGAQVALGNVGTIFWDAFVEQMRSDGREIGSVQFKAFSRGFFMAYFEHISQKDNSQAQGSVVKTMISKQICL